MVSNKRGISLLECISCAGLLIPLFMSCCLAMQEFSQAYKIKQGLLKAARQASSDLSLAFERSPKIAMNRAAQDANVYGAIAVAGIVVHKSQFDNAVFNLAKEPHTVTVTVHYRSDAATGLPGFPSLDPLKLGAIVDLKSTVTCPLKTALLPAHSF